MATEFHYKTDRWMCSQTFNSRSDVQDYIDENQAMVDMYKRKLVSLAFMTEPKKFFDEEEDVRFAIQRELDEILEGTDFDLNLMDYYDRVLEGKHILENWDKAHHENGLAWHESVPDKEAYMGGDWILTCDADGYPVDYHGTPLTRESDEMDLNMAFRYVDVLKDGFTKKEYEAEREAERRRRGW